MSPTSVRSAWSRQMLGAVLSQISEGEELSVLFLIELRSLPKDKIYVTVENECLAIKWAQERLKYHKAWGEGCVAS